MKNYNDGKNLAAAFAELISKRAWYKNRGVSRKTAYRDKSAFLENRLSEKEMRNYLKCAGYEIIQEELWIKVLSNTVK